MTEPKRQWPKLGSKGALAARTYLERRGKKMLAALAEAPSDPQALLTAAQWLTSFSREGGRLPQRDKFGAALADGLRAADLHREADRVEVNEDFDGIEDISIDAAVLATRAAVGALVADTTLANFKLVQSLRHRNDLLEVGVAHSLKQAFDTDVGFGERLATVAEAAVAEASSRPRDVETQGDAEERPNEAPVLLDVWFGLRSDFVSVRGGVAHELLGIVASRDAARFMDAVVGFDDPHDLQASLDATSALADFEMWAALVSAAPPAFAADGTWNGSVVLPLLFVIASTAIERVMPVGNRDVLTAEDIKAANEACGAAAAMVAEVIFARDDGAPAAWRWAAWLTRSMMMASARGPRIPQDARDPGYAAWQLASAVALLARDRHIWAHYDIAVTPNAEAWFALMAKVLATPRDAPGFEGNNKNLADLLAFWSRNESPEAWTGEEGRTLRSASRVVRTFAKAPSTLGVRLLALPFTTTAEPAAEWRKLWRQCLVLRDEVEFEKPQTQIEEERDPQAAAGLLRLVVDLGLCIVDQLLDERVETPADRKTSLAALAPALRQAIGEMLVIDRFGGEEWHAMSRHLIARAALYSEQLGGLASVGIDAPAMLAAAAFPDRNFFLLLVTLLSAAGGRELVAALLKSAAIDLDALLRVAERLNRIDERRPAVSAENIAKLRAVGELVAQP